MGTICESTMVLFTTARATSSGEPFAEARQEIVSQARKGSHLVHTSTDRRCRQRNLLMGSRCSHLRADILSLPFQGAQDGDVILAEIMLGNPTSGTYLETT